jgi:hypothetical protein
MKGPDGALLNTPLKGAGNDYGLRNYQSTLGKTLGSTLYTGVSRSLQYDRVAGYADSAFKLGLNAAGDYIKALDSKDNVSIDPRAVDLLVDATMFHISRGTQQFVRGEGSSLIDSMQGYVDDNPTVVAGVAIAAAGAAIAANMSIPELSHRLKLNEEMTLRLGADLGRFRSITLERFSAQLEYRKNNLSMSLGVTRTFTGDQPGTRVGVGLNFSF